MDRRDQDLIALIAHLRGQGRLVDESMLQVAAADLDRWRADGINVIAAGDPGYPPRLAGLSDAPPLLFAKGLIDVVDRSAVAIVGTRHPDAQGLSDAAASAQTLARAGHTVVSGLAAGIDTAAHVATLAADARTIAVLGNGLDHVYPPENAELQARIPASGGALISQFWPELGPTRQAFPQRNALMAALTIATVIVEAHATSGTRIQARKALEYGRRVILFERVLAQPWAQALAEQAGVQVVSSAEDLTDALNKRHAAE